MKIVIIGGGPAGATAARFLAPFYDVTLIHRSKNFEKPCGGGIKTKIFDELNLPKRLIKTQIDRVLMKYKKTEININLQGKNLSIVERKEFDEELRNIAVKNNAKLYYGTFKKIENDTAFIKIENETIPFQFDILIAADGVNSTVRKALGLPKIPSTITHFAKTSEYKTDTCEFFFDFETGGKYYAWAFPHGNYTHIGSVSRENFRNLCNRLNLNLKPKGYKIPTWQKDIVIQRRNVFFVGDAAGQVMPLSFEGIYYAMHSAKILADSIINDKDYEIEWKKRFLKEFKLLKILETLNKTFIRGLVIKAHKTAFVQNLSIKTWLGEYHV